MFRIKDDNAGNVQGTVVQCRNVHLKESNDTQRTRIGAAEPTIKRHFWPIRANGFN
jgi:hypothetical protein